jgi:hypothetical protein
MRHGGAVTLRGDGIARPRPSFRMKMRVPAVVLLILLGACKEHPDNYAPQTKPTSSVPANGTPFPSASVAALVNPAHLPPYLGPTGSVEGTVTLTGDPSPDTKNRDYAKCPAGEAMYRKLFREGTPRPDGSRPVPDVLVAVTGYAGSFLPEQKRDRTATIEGCALTSRTIDMTVGQRLNVLNKTPTKIFAPALMQTPTPSVMMATPDGDPVSLYPPGPGVYTLYDRFGSGSAYLTGEVYVLPQPLHAVTDLDGHYRIDGVPVGKLVVNARLGVVDRQTSKPVEVTANLVQTVDLELTYKTPPPAPAPSVPASPAPSDSVARPNLR